MQRTWHRQLCFQQSFGHWTQKLLDDCNKSMKRSRKRPFLLTTTANIPRTHVFCSAIAVVSFMLLQMFHNSGPTLERRYDLYLFGLGNFAKPRCMGAKVADESSCRGVQKARYVAKRSTSHTQVLKKTRPVPC